MFACAALSAEAWSSMPSTRLQRSRRRRARDDAWVGDDHPGSGARWAPGLHARDRAGFADVAIKRWQAFSGKDAICADTGLSFDDIASTRGAVGVAGAA